VQISLSAITDRFDPTSKISKDGQWRLGAMAHDVQDSPKLRHERAVFIEDSGDEHHNALAKTRTQSCSRGARHSGGLAKEFVMFRSITSDKFEAPVLAFDPGPAPIVQWLKICQLVVDPTYQRAIGNRGTTNIKAIAEHFNWSKFAPVIVAPIEGGRFAVVDGQHRATAALLRGLEEVPCQIVQADRAQQAAAYAAVNGNVTKTTPQQLFHARLAAGDIETTALAEVCAAAEVTIVRHNLWMARVTKGQTQAVGCLTRCLNEYGRATLITALQCITQTAHGNPGMVKPTYIEALCKVLKEVPEWRDAGEKLLRAMDEFEFADVWDATTAEQKRALDSAVKRKIVERIFDHLRHHLGDPKQKKAA
jgi:ParB-like nuclease domain